MGSDDLHHKRKQEAKRSLARIKNRREQYDSVLIVCEGTRSEPNYLRGLRDELKLNGANIKVLGRGTDPLSIVEYVLEEFKKGDYDRAYCVFDKDRHQSYQSALDRVNACNARKENNIPIYAITSVPCFEYWILLHFVDSAKPYDKTGNKSAGDNLKDEIKRYIPITLQDANNGECRI